MSTIETLRNHIRKHGFLSSSRIKIYATQLSTEFKDLSEEELVKQLECADIKSINYSNLYVEGLKSKVLFYYVGATQSV